MTYEIDQKVEEAIKALQKHADKMLEMQELLELAVEAYDSTSSELTEDFDSEYKRQVVSSESDDDMTFGEMVGLLGKTYIYGAETINEARRPMTLRVLQLAKDTLDGFTIECNYLIDELVVLYNNAYDEINLFSERARRSMLHHSTSMASILRQMARDKFGEFMPLDTIDQCFEPHICAMENYVSGKVADIKDVVPPDISEVMGATVDELKESVLAARRQLVDTVVSYAVVMVGEDEGKELAVKVFGVQEVEQSQQRRPMVRKVLLASARDGDDDNKDGGEFGETAERIGDATGPTALQAAGDLVGTLAKGLGSTAGSLLGTTGNVVQNITNCASNVLNNILGASNQQQTSIMDTAKNVAGSLIDCAGGIGKSLVGGVGDVAKSLISTGGDAAKGLMDFAGSLWDAGSDMAKGLFSSIGDMLGFADKEAKDTVDDAQKNAQDMQNSQEQAAQDYANDERAKAMEEAAEQMAGEMNSINWEDQWRQEGKGQDDGREFPPEEKTPQQQDQEQRQKENKENKDQDSKPSSTTYPTADQPAQDDSLEATGGGGDRKIGWDMVTAEVKRGLMFMMHDGDQQLFNPFGHPTGSWTMYSFRPADARKTWPQIAITPSSFEAIKSMDDMLNLIPYVVVKEYFFKNTASTMIDFIAKISDAVKGAFNPANQDAKGDTEVKEQSSQGSADAKSFGDRLMDKIKGIFGEVDARKQVIDIPYILYAGLRQRQYGNTYVLPYLADSGTVINQAGNSQEWDKGGGLMETIKNAIGNLGQFIGNAAAAMAGSDAKAATLFPAPTWTGPAGSNDKPEFTFELILINDNIVKSRNNYMCVNTIIHNNRSMQKAILSFPGALYEVWLPTGQRHLMCTGDFKLYPLGLNRRTPANFFKGGGVPGANFEIGTTNGDVAKIVNPHQEGIEVIPDAFKLSITFKSCLPNNMNTAVFQYYVKMSGYDDGVRPGGQEGLTGAFNAITGEGFQTETKYPKSEAELKAEQEESQANANESINRSAARSELVDQREIEEFLETFEEATYNKTIGKLNASRGEQATTSQGVVEIIRNSQTTIGESQRFLDKLYNAQGSELWYRSNPNEELQTTFKPDYRSQLQRRYQSKMKELRQVDSQLKSTQSSIQDIDAQLSRTMELGPRADLLRQRVALMKTQTTLVSKRSDIADDLVLTDTDMIQLAFDEHDDVVSVKRKELNFRVFQQFWNEYILNPYEREQLQYLTSEEKERYFKDKVRELQKFDTYGILAHQDWFFRVVVLDFIVAEMRRLVLWFKNCAWNEFDTIYRITRKLRMLQLDVDSVRSDAKFDINRTNLFQITDKDAKDYTKIDQMLEGNTLYQLFMAQLKVNMVVPEDVDAATEDGDDKAEQKEIVADRESEMQVERLRSVRNDIVARKWGSEAELTREAYHRINSDSSMSGLKERIIELKLENADSSSSELSNLLADFTNQVRVAKEAMVIEEMNKMHQNATEEIEKKDGSANAEIRTDIVDVVS